MLGTIINTLYQTLVQKIFLPSISLSFSSSIFSIANFCPKSSEIKSHVLKIFPNTLVIKINSFLDNWISLDRNYLVLDNRCRAPVSILIQCTSIVEFISMFEWENTSGVRRWSSNGCAFCKRIKWERYPNE